MTARAIPLIPRSGIESDSAFLRVNSALARDDAPENQDLAMFGMQEMSECDVTLARPRERPNHPPSLGLWPARKQFTAARRCRIKEPAMLLGVCTVFLPRRRVAACDNAPGSSAFRSTTLVVEKAQSRNGRLNMVFFCFQIRLSESIHELFHNVGQ